MKKLFIIMLCLFVLYSCGVTEEIEAASNKIKRVALSGSTDYFIDYDNEVICYRFWTNLYNYGGISCLSYDRMNERAARVGER